MKIFKNEMDYCFELAQSMKGDVEVDTLGGRIDVLTKTHLIEVKRIEGWKSGLGQLLVYGQSYPNHTLELHLLITHQKTVNQHILNSCAALNVSLKVVNVIFDYQKKLTKTTKTKEEKPQDLEKELYNSLHSYRQFENHPYQLLCKNYGLDELSAILVKQRYRYLVIYCMDVCVEFYNLAIKLSMPAELILKPVFNLHRIITFLHLFSESQTIAALAEYMKTLSEMVDVNSKTT